MLGVTIGIGEGWNEVATRAAARMEAMTGLKCVVIDKMPCDPGLVHPSWVKCLVPRMWPGADSFLVFDADVWCARKWDPCALFEAMGRRFTAAPEDRNVMVLMECANHRLPWPDWYVNAGITIFGKEHAYLWEETLKLHPKYGSWLEQTGLNEVIYKTATEVARVPGIYNTLLHGAIGETPRFVGEGAINLHCDSATNLAALKRWQKTAEHIQASTPSVHTRKTRLDLLHELPKGSVGAELGVFAGHFSRQILDVVKPSKFYMVDTFEGEITSGDESGANYATLDMGPQEEVLRKAFGNGVVNIVKSDSAEWLERMAIGLNGLESNRELDWVYIDTDHSLETTRAELAAARKAVKRGGYICGHDYHPGKFPAVVYAVNEFCAHEGLNAVIFAGEKFSSYRIYNAAK